MAIFKNLFTCTCTLKKRLAKNPLHTFWSNENQLTHVQAHHIFAPILSMNSTLFGFKMHHVNNFPVSAWPWSQPPSVRQHEEKLQGQTSQTSVLPRTVQTDNRGPVVHHLPSDLTLILWATQDMGLLSHCPLTWTHHSHCPQPR